MQNIIRLFAIAGLLAGLTAAGQAPAAAPAPGAAAPGGAAPAGRGAGRGAGGAAAQAGPAMSLGQRIAVGQINDAVTDLQAKATAAATALTQAAYALPMNRTTITQRAKDLGDAELALANARATAFDKVQKSPEKLSAEQKTVLTGRGGRGGAPVSYSDYSTGFVKIFDGKTLNGWDGEEGIFWVEDGAMHMDVSRPGSGGQHHIHYVGGPGLPPKVFGDFDFKVEFLQSASGNGGVQYHSRLLSAAHSTDGKARGVYDPKVMADPFGKAMPANIHTVADALKAGLIKATTDNPWQVSGYQFDIVAPAAGGLGQFYEGQGSRFILTNPGNVVETFPGNVVGVLGTIQAEGAPNAAAQFAKPGEWNQLEIIARGHTFIHMLNGHILTVTVEDDPVRFAKSGMLSLQCEGGSIAYRNVYLRIL